MATKLKVFTVLLPVVITMLLLPATVYGEQLSPNSEAAALIDITSGRILYEKDMGKKLPMASTTKIMTAIIAIENGRPEDIVTAGLRAQNAIGSSIYLQAGEKLTLDELLHGLMLQSGNDAAIAIAEHIGRDYDDFVWKMNRKAMELGALASNFTNPHGLHDEEHYTTAQDLAIITAYALKNPYFSRIVATKQRKIPWWGRDYSRVLNNKNKILWQVEGGDGVKIGFTKKSGRCLVSSATREDWQLASVVLNCGPMWEESKGLLEYGFSTFKPVTFFEKGQCVGTVEIINGKKKEVNLKTDKILRVPLTEEEKLRVELRKDMEDSIMAPVIKDQLVGTIKIMLDGAEIARTNVVCEEDVLERDIKSVIPLILRSLF